MKSEILLDNRQAYLAMFHFLNNYYDRCKTDEIGEILGSMRLLSNGRPADLAYESDWKEAVEQALKHDSENNKTV